tara:strand:- start:1724 stop:3727 length:2004 start_codon:yes stop_codon:yes gene_type:complete
LRQRNIGLDVVILNGDKWIQIRRKKLADGGIIAFHTDITDIKTSEERFRKVFRSSPALVSISTVDTATILDVNDVWLKTLGYEKSEVIGKSPSDLNMAVKPDIRSLAAKLKDQEHFESLEVQANTKSGEIRDFLVSGERIEFEGHECYLFISQDITERKKAEVSAKEISERFRSIFDNANTGIALTNLDGHFREVNNAFAQILGYEIEEMQTMQVSDIVHPDDLSWSLEQRTKMIEGATEQQIAEMKHRHKDGRVIWAAVSRSVIRDDDGSPRYVIAQIQDITERKKAEATAKESSKRFRSIFDKANTGITLANLDGRFLEVNEAFAQMLGYDIKELQTKQISDVVHPDDLAWTLEQRKQMIEGTAENKIAEVRHCRKDGSIFWGLVSRSIITDDEGASIYVIGQIQDITVRIQAEDALRRAKDLAEHANHTKSEFLTNISHELRTPLNVILGYGQLLKDNPKEELSSVQVKHIEKLLSSGRHLKDLITDILDLTKFEAGIVTILSERVAPQDVINDSTSIISKLVQDADIDLTCNTSEYKLPDIWVDRVRLRQALVNILSNAVKYNSKQGKIVLETKPLDNGLLRISVSDTGSGIPPERRNEIYLPFTRLNDDDAEISGTGIGLTITKHLVEAMGGRIDFECTASGSTFWIDLPVVDATKQMESNV